MNINASLSALGNLLALIQASNPAWAAVTEAELSVQSVAEQAADAAGRNAVATVALTGYTDTASFQFTRLGLTDNVASPALALSVDPTTQSAADVHAAIATALALVVDEVEISSDAFNADGSLATPASGTTATVLVQANATSLLYVASSQVTITLNFPPAVVVPPPVPSIASITTVTALDGFTAVSAPAATDGTSTTPPAADGTSSTPPAADGTSTTPPATDGTAPAGDGTTVSTPADGTTPVASAGSDGSSTTPAVGDGTNVSSVTPPAAS